jgi:hypothetical protein
MIPLDAQHWRRQHGYGEWSAVKSAIRWPDQGPVAYTVVTHESAPKEVGT